MRILWDFRLFSLGYGKKGVGKYTSSLCIDFLNHNTDYEIYILGLEADIPEEISSKCKLIINYNINSWKQDLFLISKIIKKYNIDIIHYWIALGPLHQIGQGFNKNCKTVATIHDLAVENWHGIPFLQSKKRSWYWKVQKLLINRANQLIFNSIDTQKEFFNLKRKFRGSHIVIYPNIESCHKEKTINKTLMALGGSKSKNLKRTIEAFNLFYKNNPQFKLLIAGNAEELKSREFDNRIIEFIPYSSYYKKLSSSMALLAFSVHEGLGLPPIEAMSVGVPSAVSDLPSFKETLEDSAVYANPLDIKSMSSAINKVISQYEFYHKKTEIQFLKYSKTCKGNGQKLLTIYNNLIKQK